MEKRHGNQEQLPFSGSQEAGGSERREEGENELVSGKKKIQCLSVSLHIKQACAHTNTHTLLVKKQKRTIHNTETLQSLAFKEKRNKFNIGSLC